jgi:hypothetical protein
MSIHRQEGGHPCGDENARQDLHELGVTIATAAQRVAEAVDTLRCKRIAR